MKTQLTEAIGQIEARNDAALVMLHAALQGDDEAVEGVTTAVAVQGEKIQDFEKEWCVITPPASLGGMIDEARSEKVAFLTKRVRDTASEMSYLIAAVNERFDEPEQLLNSAYAIARSQREYVRELRDLVGDV